MTISKSYPYLSIANKHNVDYGVVLKMAHAATFGGVADLGGQEVDESVWNDVQDAAAHFRAVQRGVLPFPPT